MEEAGHQNQLRANGTDHFHRIHDLQIGAGVGEVEHYVILGQRGEGDHLQLGIFHHLELVRNGGKLAPGSHGNGLKSTAPIGKKMDFLVQETNREINTTGSKANNLEMSKTVVEMKSELEKIREQIQNVE